MVTLADENRAARTEPTCPTCGQALRGDSPRKKYCSRACQLAGRKGRSQQQFDAIRCAMCDRSFTPTRSTQRFCSDDCRHAARNAERATQSTIGVLVRRRCRTCGEEYDVARRDDTGYCCSGCRDARHLVRPDDLLNSAPQAQSAVAGWLNGIGYKRADRVWVSVVVEQFGQQGERAALADALNAVRSHYRTEIGNAKPD